MRPTKNADSPPQTANPITRTGNTLAAIPPGPSAPAPTSTSSGSFPEGIQELLHINIALPQQTRQGSHLDRLVEGDNTTTIAASHDHVAAALAHRLEPQPFQCADDLPAGKMRELRHAQER